jgi:light-regulated signal transduction histidine kinase (bacteriophytochrome)
MVSAPLMAGGEAIGALNLGFREVRTFSPGELRLLETIGQILGTAMQNTQLYTQVQELVSNLKRSNAELEQFAYIASHDLQEPLRMVSSYMQLIAKRYQGKLDSDADEFIAYAVDGAGRMKSMINDLLTFSRLGTRGKPFQPVDTEAVLNAALENLKLAVEDSHAAVTHDPLPSVLADESQVAQLFQNLIGNALKFHGDEPPRIHVSARKTPQFWEFSVRDNGIGIDPQFFERVFLIFQRLSTRAEHAGSGIGLAICKKIVERHGGRIWIESKPGEGTTFFFTLPAG